ncbi:hypothetical protein WAI89_21355, partial [Acinetobacter baumannii]
TCTDLPCAINFLDKTPAKKSTSAPQIQGRVTKTPNDSGVTFTTADKQRGAQVGRNPIAQKQPAPARNATINIGEKNIFAIGMGV